ncbi:MAG: 3'(2'),5'-bisphosphate nucleotidase CysQ [Caulobacteraceae bacterium]|nr:3'(2'),5'-bisphosphate nucleotidase CysQ [Caulobacter sp.]
MSDLPLLEAAAREAGRLMLDMRAAGLKVSRKSDGSPVTDADLACDALLKRRLREARPAYGWLSEETADDKARLGAQRVFVVDPVDGTTAFIRNRPWFAVSLAVVEGGRPVAGAVFAPELDELHGAQAGGGAWLNGRRAHVSGRGELSGCSVVGDPGQFPADAWPAISVTRRNALAYRMALVADGRFDAAVSVTPKREWDIAAGTVIAAEAGAAVTDRDGRPLVFNSLEARLPGLVCCTPALLPLILQRTAARAAAPDPA